MRALVHDDHALNSRTLEALDEQGGKGPDWCSPTVDARV
jgi:hypothetical protein